MSTRRRASSAICVGDADKDDDDEEDDDEEEDYEKNEADEVEAPKPAAASPRPRVCTSGTCTSCWYSRQVEIVTNRMRSRDTLAFTSTAVAAASVTPE